jgi:hypothetical protein
VWWWGYALSGAGGGGGGWGGAQLDLAWTGKGHVRLDDIDNRNGRSR